MKIALDFDGVIYSNDSVIQGAEEAMRAFMNLGHKVYIFTARDDLWPVLKVLEAMKFPAIACLAEHDTRIITVTNKKPEADIYVDDRAYRFTGEWGKAFEEIDRILSE